MTLANFRPSLGSGEALDLCDITPAECFDCTGRDVPGIEAGSLIHVVGRVLVLELVRQGHRPNLQSTVEPAAAREVLQHETAEEIAQQDTADGLAAADATLARKALSHLKQIILTNFLVSAQQFSKTNRKNLKQTFDFVGLRPEEFGGSWDKKAESATGTV